VFNFPGRRARALIIPDSESLARSDGGGIAGPGQPWAAIAAIEPSGRSVPAGCHGLCEWCMSRDLSESTNRRRPGDRSCGVREALRAGHFVIHRGRHRLNGPAPRPAMRRGRPRRQTERRERRLVAGGKEARMVRTRMAVSTCCIGVSRPRRQPDTSRPTAAVQRASCAALPGPERPGATRASRGPAQRASEPPPRGGGPGASRRRGPWAAS
jgi:hypothetical protein